MARLGHGRPRTAWQFSNQNEKPAANGVFSRLHFGLACSAQPSDGCYLSRCTTERADEPAQRRPCFLVQQSPQGNFAGLISSWRLHPNTWPEDAGQPGPRSCCDDAANGR